MAVVIVRATYEPNGESLPLYDSNDELRRLSPYFPKLHSSVRAGFWNGDLWKQQGVTMSYDFHESFKTRPIPSNALSEVRRGRRVREAALDPWIRLESAFALSRAARRLFFAGLQSKGFFISEITALYRKGRL